MRNLPLFAVLALAACAGSSSSSSTLPPRALKAASIPAALATPDSSLFGWARLRRPVELLRLLGMATLYEKIRAAVPLDEIADQPLTAFVWDGGNPMGPPELGLALPSAARGVMNLVSLRQWPTRPSGALQLVAITPSALPRFAAAHEAIAAAPLAPHFELVVKGAPLRERYGAMMKTVLAMAQAKQTDNTKAEAMNKLVAWIDAVEELRVDLSAPATGVALDVVSHHKATAPEPAVGPSFDLVGRLPAGHIRYELDGPSFGASMSKWMVVGMAQLEQQQSAAGDRLKATADQLGKEAARLRFGVSLRFLPDSNLGMAMVAYGETAPSYHQKLLEMYRIYEDPASNQELAAAGLVVKIATRRNARQHHGVAIDHYDLEIESKKLMPDADAAALAKKLGKQSIDVAQVGKFLVSVTNAPPETINDILDAARGGKPLSPGLDALTMYPDSGAAYGDLDVQAMYDWIRGLGGAMAKLPAATLPGKILFHSAHETGAARYRFHVARATIDAIALAVQQAK